MGATLSVHQTISPLRIQEDIHQSQDQNATKGNLQAAHHPVLLQKWQNLWGEQAVYFHMVYILTKGSRILNFTFKNVLIV